MNWQKYITRRIAAQVAQAWNFGWGEAMEKVYGVSLKNVLVFKDDKKTEYYIAKDEHDKYINALYRLLEKEDFLRTFHKDAAKKLESILSDTKNKLGLDLGKLDNKQLLDIYQNFILPSVEQFYIRMWTVFNIAEPLANTVYKYLQNTISQDKVDKYLLNLSSPLEPNDIINERIDLLEIANNKSEDIKEHTKKYQHIPMFDFDHDPYTEDYFLKELNKIDNPKEELAEIRAMFIDRSKQFEEILKDLKPDSNHKLLLEFLKENVWLRDYRDMIRQKLNLELRRFYTIIGQRLDLNLQEVATLTNQEIIDYLKESKKFPKDEVGRRDKTYLLIQKNNHAEIYSGDAAIEKFQQEVKQLDNTKYKDIKGLVASIGKAKGRVRIVYTNKDLHKVEAGDILVATMTRQDFVPAIRKSAALITDEGGVTCHAAIIARELGIPCVVGTKYSTQVLQDGDIVEVDAEKGIVRKV